MPIEPRITNIWPHTEADLLKDATTVDYIGARDTAIGDAIAKLYRTYAPGEVVPDVATVDTMDSVVQQYVAAQAVMRLIPMAKDKYKQDALSVGESYNPGGSGNTTHYNKINVLDGLRKELQQTIESLTVDVIAVIRPVTPPAPVLHVPLFTVARGRRGG